MAIHYATGDFDFSKVHLAHPVPTHGGGYYTKINHTAADESLYVFTPKGTTRTGVVTSGGKKYIDLVFTAANTNLIEWVTALEERLQAAVFEKKDAWFAEDLELDDIQEVFIPVMRAYKGGVYVLRAYLQQGRTKIPTLPQVYDEHETPRTLDDVVPSAELITILDFQGIKFTAKSFAVSIAVKQIMVLQHTPTFNQCRIKASEICKVVDVKEN